MIDGRTVALSDADLLGVGGEANVYRYGATAVKVLHTPDPV